MKTAKRLSFLITILLFTSSLFGQGFGSIKGQIYDKALNSTLPGASVYIKMGNNKIGAVTDIQGYFTIKPLDPGIYTLNVSYVGFNNRTLYQVKVSPDRITFLDPIYLSSEAIEHGGKTFTVVGEPLIQKDGGSYKKISGKELATIPVNNDLPTMLSYMSSDITVSDNGKDVYFRGARSGDAVYIIDGVKLPNSDLNIPGRSIASMTVYSGGVPAKYGDFTGGVVVIETKSYFSWKAQQEANAIMGEDKK